VARGCAVLPTAASQSFTCECEVRHVWIKRMLIRCVPQYLRWIATANGQLSSMRTKNNKFQPPDFADYLQAHQHAYAWAQKAMVCRSAGKLAQARAAVAKVNHWLRRIAMLEAANAGTI
jgi:hypothetical protein